MRSVNNLYMLNVLAATMKLTLVQKNALNQSLKQIRSERDELFTVNQKLKQEKMAAEVSERHCSNVPCIVSRSF
jgi:cell division protein FtsB